MIATAETSSVDRRRQRGLRLASQAVENARLAGLLDGDKDHVTLRLPRALIDAAQKNTGIDRKTDLGVAAFALLAQRDPFIEFLMDNYGVLGPDHTLDY